MRLVSRAAGSPSCSLPFSGLHGTPVSPPHAAPPPQDFVLLKGEVREHQPVPLREALARPVSEWKECLVNDFEETVFTKHPELAAVKQSLYDAGAVYAAMSGSGSALFALFATSAGV